jgi:hypothetical protein
MPQAPQWLRDRFPNDDAEASAVLQESFNIDRGVISPKSPNYRWTKRERDAVYYLVYEWDYDWAPCNGGL